MNGKFSFTLKQVVFDENYYPADSTRLTTNFANLARGEHRQENLRNALRMIDNRFNALAQWDNPEGNRYSVELAIISVGLDIEGKGDPIPLIDMLYTTIVDKKLGKRINGILGNNFSSYVRDYDFSIVLPEHNKGRGELRAPDDFGDLHGNLFRHFIRSVAYTENFDKLPVICISVSSSQTYHRIDNRHPVLGVEYVNDSLSLTDQYFGKMGLKVRYFMPPGGVAPLAFYCAGDLLNDYTNLELISTISTMEVFQKIYRPEIYNANAAAPMVYRPTLTQQDYSLTRIRYDREERSRLGVQQGQFAAEHFITPHRATLERWLASDRP
ncbi:DUF1852 domain-containing protein [Neokomagataea thailandica]|nr:MULTISPECIES: DUF1852 domain-containing protein [Neokomagataea]